jgi:hypothetical protein
MISAGYGTVASRYVEQALEAEPTMSIPRDVLPATVATKVAAALERDGLHEQARQVLLQLIENDPGIKLDSADQEILGGTSPSAGARIGHALASPLVLACLAALILLAFALWAKSRRRLHFQPFEAAGDADAGPGPTSTLRSLIRTELHRLAEEQARRQDGRRLRIDQAGPYEDRFDLGPVVDSLPAPWKPLALVTGVLMKGMGTRARLICGMLLPASSVILEIRTVDGTVKDMCTIRHHELGFPPSEQEVLPQLAMPSAAWIALTHYPEATLGGTRDWRSYVNFAVGCAWQVKGETDRARDWYIRACDHPDNLAAKVNLAALEQREECAVPQRDPAALPSYKRLSSLVHETADRTDDLQWYRTRYLLSAGLRDILDLSPNGTRHHAASPAHNNDSGHQAASANGDGPRSGETLVDLARRRAAELALELEEKISNRGGLPLAFVEYGRAAALTLVARQVDLRTGSLDKMLVPGAGRPDYADGGAVKRALRDILDGRAADGTAERLVGFVRSCCPLDDQAQYNLYRYHQSRATHLADAIESWNATLRQARQRYGEEPPDRVRFWADDVSRWQKALSDLYGTELSQMEECARQVETAGDVALIERLKVVRKLDPTEPEFRYSVGGRHGRPSAEGSRLSQPAPSVTPDDAGPAPDPGQSWPPVPDEPSLPAQWSPPSPTRPGAERFDPHRPSGPADVGGEYAAPSRLDFSDSGTPEEFTSAEDGIDNGRGLVFPDVSPFSGFSSGATPEDGDDGSDEGRSDTDDGSYPGDDDEFPDEPAV